MDRVEQIEAAISGLDPEEYRRFVQWFRAREQARWDEQFKNYRLCQRDPHHASLHFRRLHGAGDRFTIRVGEHYRTRFGSSPAADAATGELISAG